MEHKRRQVHIVRTGKQPIAPIDLRTAAVLRQQSQNGLPSDVLGSYTGTPLDYSQPEQDPDDL